MCGRKSNAGFLFSTLLLTLFAAVPARSQDREVLTAVKQDVSPTLREMAAAALNSAPAQAQERFLGRIPLTPSAGGQDRALQTQALPYQSFTAGAGFDGVGFGFPGFTVQYAPPDTNAAVGANHIIQWVNASFAIFDKAGNRLQGPTPGNAPWAGFGGGCQSNNDGDPIIQYDKAAGRWIFTQFSVSTKPFLQCFAVSSGSDPITSTYYRFSFSFGNLFPDYPKMSVWPDAYYITFNIFKGNRFTGPRPCAVDRNKALAGGALGAPAMICFTGVGSSFGSMLPADLDGSTAPPAGSRNYIVAMGGNALNLWKFHVDFTTPANSTLTAPQSIPVSAFSAACGGGACIPQSGTLQKLDSLADRLMYRLAYRNNGGTESMVVNHSIQSSAISGVRWYELRVSGGNVSLFQQGTFSPDSATSRWMGSIAMDKCGDILVGYSASGSAIKPGIRLTGRVPGDPLGQLQTEAVAVTGAGSQTGGLSRWGDYSSMAVDPVDDKTFWYTTEYLKQNGSFNWSTRIIPVTFSTCN